MKTKDLNSGDYVNRITNEALRIEKRSKLRKIRRYIFLGLILLACFAGIVFGILNKNESVEAKYKSFLETPDQNSINDELLSYKDVSEKFESYFLGNKINQALMGGFFYDDSEYSIYPDENGERMIFRSNNTEMQLCDGLASDINVKDGIIYYKKLNSRQISCYKIADETITNLPIENVGQFILCGKKLYYIDLAISSLKDFDLETSESKEIIHSGVSSFAVIGNSIVFLDDQHTLYKLNLNDYSRTTVAKNIVNFSYDGKLWMQNNDRLYIKNLDEKAITEYKLDIPCNHLLGLIGTQIYVESDDGIYLFDIKTGSSQMISKGIFYGSSENKILIYDSSIESCQVIVIN